MRRNIVYKYDIVVVKQTGVRFRFLLSIVVYRLHTQVSNCKPCGLIWTLSFIEWCAMRCNNRFNYGALWSLCLYIDFCLQLVLMFSWLPLVTFIHLCSYNYLLHEKIHKHTVQANFPSGDAPRVGKHGYR